MSINDLLKKIEDLNKKIDKKNKKALKRKLLVQDKIKELEDEKFKAGFRGDMLFVEKINADIKKLKQKSHKNYSFQYEFEITSCKKKITEIIIGYYKKDQDINDIFEIENIPQDIRDEWIKSSNFGKNTGYLFVDPVYSNNEYNWRYYNPITCIDLTSKSINDLKSKIINSGETLIKFDEKLAKKSRKRDLKINQNNNHNKNTTNIKNEKSKVRKKATSKKTNKINSNSPIKKNKESVLLQQIKKIKNKQNIPSKNNKEEYAIILDYFPRGYLNSTMQKFNGKPVAQAIGIDRFTFLELAPKHDVDLEIQELVYIGKGKRDKIYRVLGKLNLNGLSVTSKIELEYVIPDIVEANEEEYVDFFNTSRTISQDFHQLGLLQGIGSKTVHKILQERKRKKFDSFEDIKKRVPNLKSPKELIVKRIKEELGIIESRRKHKYYLFIQPSQNNRKRK